MLLDGGGEHCLHEFMSTAGLLQAFINVVCRVMRWCSGKVIRTVVLMSVLLTSGCATALIRSDGIADSEHVYPATVVDAQLFSEVGIKGKPLFASTDPKTRTGPVNRLAYGVGAVIDMPFSIVFDTVLLPVDLIGTNRIETHTESEKAPDGIDDGANASATLK